jgi:hypothetical protein
MFARRLFPFVAACGLIGGPQALACSPSLRTFAELVPHTELAIRAIPRIRFTGSQPNRIEGRVRFERIRCYQKPSYMRRCPRSLEVAFDETLDGINCPPDIAGERPERMRYFRLGRSEDGAWRLDNAYRQFDR